MPFFPLKHPVSLSSHAYKSKFFDKEVAFTFRPLASCFFSFCLLLSFGKLKQKILNICLQVEKMKDFVDLDSFGEEV